MANVQFLSWTAGYELTATLLVNSIILLDTLQEEQQRSLVGRQQDVGNWVVVEGVDNLEQGVQDWLD